MTRERENRIGVIRRLILLQCLRDILEKPALFGLRELTGKSL